MPYKSVLNEDKLINAIATLRDALQDDHRGVHRGICEMLEIAESGIAYNLKEAVQKQIAFAASANGVIGAKVEMLTLVSRLIAQFTKYEFVPAKEEVTEEAIGG